MAPLHRWLLKWARTTHLYVTLFGLALLAFFAVTGFMLNHEDGFSTPEPHTRLATGTVPPEMLQTPVDRLAVVEMLRKDFGASGLVQSFEEEGDEVRVMPQAPGHR